MDLAVPSLWLDLLVCLCHVVHSAVIMLGRNQAHEWDEWWWLRLAQTAADSDLPGWPAGGDEMQGVASLLRFQGDSDCSWMLS